MKIIHEYALSHVKENRRSSIFIFVAILIASSLISAMGVFSYTEWLNEVDIATSSRGSWHGRFEEPIKREYLKYIQENPQVKEVYIQSQVQTLQLTGTKRSYINITQLSMNSWGNTTSRKALLEGKLPEKSGEMVVSKLFFTENPQYKIGDTITLPTGERVLDGSIMAKDSPFLNGEDFRAFGEQTVTITGTLNVPSVSSYPCYYAFGFLDLESPLPEGQYKVSASLNNIRKAYDVFPLLAANTGLKLDHEGRYDITYNTNLLALYGAKDPNGYGNSLDLSGYLLSALLSMGLVMLVFIILIYNAFTVTSTSQIKQLGILKSIGATPSQIRSCVRYEAFFLACIAVPLGISLGYASMAILIQIVNFLLKDTMDIRMRVVFAWPILLPSLLMSICTVFLSAWGPARKLGKLLPIEAVRYSPEAATLKKSKEHRWIHHWFGFEGDLAFNSLQANKRAYRTTLIALTLFITLFLGFQCFAAIWMMDQKQVLADKDYTLTISSALVDEPDPLMLKELSLLPGIHNQVMYRESHHTLLWDKKKISPEFQAAGGFKEDYFRGSNLEREGGHPRIYVELIGLDTDSFANFARKLDVDPTQFNHPAEHKGIIVNHTSGNVQSIIDKRKIPSSEYLDIALGDTLALKERAEPDKQSLKGYTLTVGAVTHQYPELDQYYYPFDLIIVVPMETYENIVLNLNPERGLEYQKLTYKMNIPREQLANAQQQANTILGKYLPPEDRTTRSLLDQEAYNAKLIRSIELLIIGFAVFLGVVGITGAFSAVAGNLFARRREFAVLRSAGLTPQGMNRILNLESMFFGCTPMLLSVPLLIVVCSIMLRNAASTTWRTFLVNAPWGYFILMLPLVVGVVWLAYRVTGSKIKRESIIEAIRDERI